MPFARYLERCSGDAVVPESRCQRSAGDPLLVRVLPPTRPSAVAPRTLALFHATAAELPYVPLADALAILLVLDAKDEERFEPAAVRWAGRLATGGARA